MANSNFVVQNGIEVGPYIVFAGNGDIRTSGNITTTGSGSIASANGFGGLNPASIYSSGSNVSVTSTNIFANINSVNALTISSSGVTVAGNLTVQGNTIQVNKEITTGDLLPSANATYNLGSTTAWWNTLYGVATQAKYADLAENYQADRTYAAGTVVMFGGVEEVTVADVDTTAVAGVVSTNPAHLMNGGLTGPNVVPLALQGRVPCMVVGPVKKGDLMVSAGHGYAKSSANPKLGQVIGKALYDFPGSSKAVIEVVVGRQ
jgi:hypothetical protein